MVQKRFVLRRVPLVHVLNAGTSDDGLAAIVENHARQVLRIADRILEVVLDGTELASRGLVLIFAALEGLIRGAFEDKLPAYL